MRSPYSDSLKQSKIALKKTWLSDILLWWAVWGMQLVLPLCFHPAISCRSRWAHWHTPSGHWRCVCPLHTQFLGRMRFLLLWSSGGRLQERDQVAEADLLAIVCLFCILNEKRDTNEVVDEIVDVVTNRWVVCDDSLSFSGGTVAFMDALDESYKPLRLRNLNECLQNELL